MSSVKLAFLTSRLLTILTGFWGGYQTLRPRLTKYCRGHVPGIPGGVDAYGYLSTLPMFTAHGDDSHYKGGDLSL